VIYAHAATVACLCETHFFVMLYVLLVDGEINMPPLPLYRRPAYLTSGSVGLHLKFLLAMTPTVAGGRSGCLGRGRR